MFGLLTNTAKAALGIVTLPLDVAADVVTLGGSLTDKRQPYTAQKLGQVFDNLEEAIDPNSD